MSKTKRDFKLSKFSYLTERELKFVSQNKYKGKNDSLLYKYVTSPFCNWLVKNYIPDWMAPNLITLIGFIPIFIYGYVLSYYSPNMEEPLPRYILIFSPLTVIFYNICDNCDGKQARKTDNASPLGQMFDHGIDCVVGLYVIQNTTTTIQAGNTWIQYLILIGTLGCFYMATWDEYWCGNFYLGMFNGPNEGNLFVIILNFLVFIKPDLFAMNIFGKKLSDIALPPLLIALIPVLIVNISRVSKSGNLKQYGIKRAFITTIPNIAAVTVTLGWRILNPSLFDNYPRFTWTIVGFLFANLNFRILLAHLSKNFKNWYYAQSFWVLIYIPVLYHFFGMKFISEKLFIYTYASLLILAFVHLFTSVTIDVSSYLGIKVFKNKPVFIKKKKRTFLKNK